MARSHADKGLYKRLGKDLLQLYRLRVHNTSTWRGAASYTEPCAFKARWYSRARSKGCKSGSALRKWRVMSLDVAPGSPGADLRCVCLRPDRYPGTSLVVAGTLHSTLHLVILEDQVLLEKATPKDQQMFGTALTRYNETRGLGWPSLNRCNPWLRGTRHVFNLTFNKYKETNQEHNDKIVKKRLRTWGITSSLS